LEAVDELGEVIDVIDDELLADVEVLPE